MPRPKQFGFEPYIEDDSRRQGRRDVQRNFLIVCEGERTEPLYFEAIKRRMKSGAGSKIEIVGAGTHTQELIACARNAIQKRRIQGMPPYYYVWILFDKDEFTDEDFDETDRLIAKENDRAQPNEHPFWRSGWSNEAFELWYLLHFQDVSVPMPREQIFELLGKHLGGVYDKTDPKMFERLSGYLNGALLRAERLDARSGCGLPHACNPCTKVYALVGTLVGYT